MRQKLKYLNFNQLWGESYGFMKEDRFTGPLFLCLNHPFSPIADLGKTICFW